jgi:hypothetical protein
LAFTCQECGERLPSADTHHDIMDCAEHHIERAYAIFQSLKKEHTPVLKKKKKEAK